MRSITRSDFDGLVCAAMLKEVEDIESIEFAHPKDVQDEKYEITSNDILTNLPYHPKCGKWFDHHSSETGRGLPESDYDGRYEEYALSAGRVVYNYYKSEKLDKYTDLLNILDRYDGGVLEEKSIVDPEGWMLLAYIMDPRTGLGLHHDYEISNFQLMMKMVDLIKDNTMEEILAMPDVKARIDRYQLEQDHFIELLRKHSHQDGNVLVTDLRNIEDLPVGNRFLVYTLFPGANISVRVFEGKKGENVVIAAGHSVLNRTSMTDIGELMTKYDGGGHKGAGTCQCSHEVADKTIKEIVKQMKKDG